MPIINPEFIFPKKLGIYRQNTLVVQYYDLGQDIFRKHLIPFDTCQSTDQILQNISKNPKHAPFIMKIHPNHIKNALKPQQKSQNLSLQVAQAYSKDQLKQTRISNQNQKIQRQQQELPLNQPQQHRVEIEIEQYFEQEFQDFDLQHQNKVSDIEGKSSRILIQKSQKQQKSQPVEVRSNDFKLLEQSTTTKPGIEQNKGQKTKSKDKKSSKDKKDKKAKKENKGKKKKSIISQESQKVQKSIQEQFQFL